MKKYQVVLWDFDGTLAYTGADVWASLAYAAEKCGGMLPEEYQKDDSNLGKSVKEIYQQVVPYPGEEKYDRFEELVRVHYRTINEYPGTRLYPGIRELLLELKKKEIRSYIITMKPQEALERILEKKGWEDLFDGWISPDSAPGYERTKSEMISYIIKRLGFQKERCVYVGDTWSDAAAAHENSICCIGAAYGDGEVCRLLEERPEYWVQEATGLFPVLLGGKETLSEKKTFGEKDVLGGKGAI